jgi:hypothetical protein
LNFYLHRKYQLNNTATEYIIVLKNLTPKNFNIENCTGWFRLDSKTSKFFRIYKLVYLTYSK